VKAKVVRAAAVAAGLIGLQVLAGWSGSQADELGKSYYLFGSRGSLTGIMGPPGF